MNTSDNSLAGLVFITAFIVFMVLPLQKRFLFSHGVAGVVALVAAAFIDGAFWAVGLMALVVVAGVAAYYLSLRKNRRGDA